MLASKICLIAGLALAVTLPAQAATRLFGDSVLIMTDGFSDEITGDGPAIVYVAGTESPDAVEAAVKQLRKTNRVHLIHMTDGAAASALETYLANRHIGAATVTGGGASAYLAQTTNLAAKMATKAAN
jgi:hypothetical protein